jgi:hypothetical protein
MSIRFAEAFVGAGLCKSIRRMGSLGEKSGDGRCMDRNGVVYGHGKVHTISLYLSLYRGDCCIRL